jgi:hypothetical protein
MPVDYTDAEIAEMEQIVKAKMPRLPKRSDLEAAPWPVSMTTAATERGLLINFAAQNGNEQMLLLSPVLVRHLLHAILTGQEKGEWWDENGNSSHCQA